MYTPPYFRNFYKSFYKKYLQITSKFPKQIVLRNDVKILLKFYWLYYFLWKLLSRNGLKI